jgi:hypothetical protein
VLTDDGRARRMRAAGLERAATFTWEAAAGACVSAYRIAAQAPTLGRPATG